MWDPCAATLVAQAAQGFGVSTILTTVAEKSFSGPLFPELLDTFASAPRVPA